MSHEEDGRLMAYLDGELDVADAGAVESHLRSCADCTLTASRLRTERARVGAALPQMDVDASAAARRVRERIAREVPVAAPSRSPSRTARPHPAARPSWIRRSRVLQAALFVLFVAGGASALVPGSPLRRLLDRGQPSAAQKAVPLLIEERAPASAAVAQVSVGALPSGGRLRVALDVPAGTELNVTFAQGEQATVHANPDTGFRRADGVLEATVQSGPVRVELPRTGAEVSLEVKGQLYLRMQNGQVLFRAPGADSSDAQFTFRVP